MSEEDELQEFALWFEAEDSPFAVMVEADGRVIYAYLLEDRRIVADVWLGNIDEPPSSLDHYKEPSEMPFLNAFAFCDTDETLDLGGEFQCEWRGNEARIRLSGELIAILQPGSKPGWSRLARRDGPLALRLAAYPSRQAP